MGRRLAERGCALLALLALGAVGCGSSGKVKHPLSESTTTIRRLPSAGRDQARAHRAPSKAASRTTTTSPGTLTAPPPIPPGTPPAADGLAQTTGYRTYELCASECAGTLPPALRRGLHLPALRPGAACPVSAAGGPVSLEGSAIQLSLEPFIGSAWEGARVTWRSTPAYRGPVLIRGRQLGGPHAVGFGEGHLPYDELQLLGRAFDAPAGPARQWPSFTRVRGPGCYAYQLDGTSFSDVIVFRAVG